MDQAGVCLGSKKLGISASGAGATPAEIQIDHPTPAEPRSFAPGPARAGAASAKPVQKQKRHTFLLDFRLR